MNKLFGVLGLFFLLIAIVMVLGTALFIGFGALLARWLPLTLFQASGLVIGATIAFAAMLYALATIIRHSDNSYDMDDDFEDEEDSEDEDDDFIPEASALDSSFSRPDFSKVSRNDYCPCGSGRKYKNCCETTTGR